MQVCPDLLPGGATTHCGRVDKAERHYHCGDTGPDGKYHYCYLKMELHSAVRGPGHRPQPNDLVPLLVLQHELYYLFCFKTEFFLTSSTKRKFIWQRCPWHIQACTLLDAC